ncbi:MAG: patatin-like phospholipase family protein [Psychromonas sp.]
MRYFLLLTLLISSISFAESRPKIGLALGGGGAKGAAHIGILRILEENNIPIDYIAGTSIGAYIGGLYALGYSADEIEVIMLNTEWDKGFSDFIPREDLQYPDKQLRDEYNITVRLGYSDSEFKVPGGLLLGQSAFQLLKLSTDTFGELSSFDELPIPFRAVATNIATSEAVVLDSGSLSQAIRASSTVPGIVEPTVIDGNLLVDGAIVNNIPIDVVKKMGADIVIAVDIGSPLVAQKDIKSTVDVLNQLSTILTINTTNQQKLLLTENDLLIRPEIDKLSTTDFSIMSEALILGEKAAQENIEKIQVISISDEEYAQYRLDKKQHSEKWFAHLVKPVVEIKYDNDSKVDVDIIADHLGISIGDVVTKEELDAAISRVYALDRFDQVNVEFVDSDKGRTLVLSTREKSWGPNYIHFGFGWQGDFSSESQISLDLAYILTDITDNGGQWKNELSLGWQPMLATEFYQPFDHKQEFFGRARLMFNTDKYAENEYNLLQTRPELINQYFQGRLGVGYNYTDNGISEVGFVGESGEIKFEKVDYENLDYTSVGAYLSIGYDTLNSINFPTRGNKISFDVFLRKDDYDHQWSTTSDEPSVEIDLDWSGAFGIGKHTFVGIGSFATVLTDNDASIRVSELGGFLNLSGYHQDALIGAHKAFGAVVYQYDLGSGATTGLPIYLGTSVETGNVWALNDTVDIDELVTAASLYLGTDTSFGPAVIGLGYSKSFADNLGDEARVFFSLGKNW